MFICWYMLSCSCFFGEDHNFLFGWDAFECFETLSFLLVFSSGQEPSPTSKDERLQQRTIPNHPPMSWCISMQLIEHLWNSRNCCQNPCKTEEKGFSCNFFSALSWQKWWFLEELSIPTACYPWKIWVVSFRSKAIGAKRSPIFDKRYSYVKRPSAQHIQIHCWLPTICHRILGILPIKALCSCFLFSCGSVGTLNILTTSFSRSQKVSCHLPSGFGVQRRCWQRCTAFAADFPAGQLESFDDHDLHGEVLCDTAGGRGGEGGVLRRVWKTVIDTSYL